MGFVLSMTEPQDAAIAPLPIGLLLETYVQRN